MKPKTKRRLAIILLSLFIGAMVGTSVYLVIGTVYFGIPFWWLVPRLPILSSAPTTLTMSDTINPNNPTILSQHETISLFSVNNHSAIVGATVTIFYSGSQILTFLTNSSGQGDFVYAGEPTIIRVDMNGYYSINDVLPHAPEHWVQDRTIAQISAAISGIGSAGALTGVYVTMKRSKMETTRKKPRPKHRK